jgi:tetratricopeptide (TPR) repeat protein
MANNTSKHKNTQTKNKQDTTNKPFVSPLLILSAIVLYVLVLYSNSLHNSILTFDDNEYFNDYPEVRNLSWQSIIKYFSGYYVIMYQPLPVLSFALNYHFTGTDVFYLHLTNLLLHCGCIVLVFHLVKNLTSNNTAALLVAFLFGIHPMNVEAVSWISARSSSMYTLFYLLSLIQYLKYLKGNQTKYVLYTALFFILSLFSKAQAVTLPVVLLLLDFYHNRKLLSSKVITQKIPFLILSLVFGYITIANAGTMRNLTAGMLINYSVTDYPFLIAYSFAFYILKFLLPFNLCAVYVFPPKINGLLPWEYYASAVLFAAVLYALFRFRKNKILLLCAGLFFITISINIQIIPSRLFIVTDRYAYFPYLGLLLLPVFLFLNLKANNAHLYKKYAAAFYGILIFMSLIFSYSVYSRNIIWNNDVVFLTDIIEKNPTVPYLYRAYGNRGMALKRTNKPNEAIADFTEAIKIDSSDGRSFFNRALTYASLNKNLEALTDFNEAEKRDSNQVLIYSNRAQVKFLLNDTTGSEEDCFKTLQLDSLNIDAYNTLANISFGRKDYNTSEIYLNKTISINPQFSIGYKNRGTLYLLQNKKAEACSDLLTASNLNNQEAKNLFSQYCK